MSVNSKMTAIADNIRGYTGGVTPLTLDGIAEGVNDVYDVAHRNGINEGFTDGYTVGYSNGKASMIDESKIIEKTVTGSIISVDDVSEIPHEVGIQLSSDTVTDFSGVTVKAKGNLFDINKGKYSGNSQGTVNGDKITVHQTYASTYVSYNMEIPDSHLLLGKVVRIRAKCKNAEVSTNAPAMRLTLMNGSTWVSGYFDYYDVPNVYGEIDIRGAIPEILPQNAKLCLMFYSNFTGGGSGEINKPIEYSNIVMTIDNNNNTDNRYIPYAPYREQTAIATADGTVKGITSISPNMTVFTDDAEIRVTMKYHKSYGMQTEYERFWYNMFYKTYPDGEMNYAFAGFAWNNPAVFRPNRNLKPTNAQNMFSYWNNGGRIDLVEHFAELGISLDFSNCEVMNSCFYTNTSVTRLGVIDLTKAGKYAQAIFYTASNLVTIEEIIIPDNVTSLNNTFGYCYNLQNIKVSGVIPVAVSFQWSTKLSKVSITSIINALSSTTSGLTVTLSKTAVTNAFGSTTATEWTTLIATKSNWTISLV